MSKLDQILYESLTPSHQPSDDLNRRIIRRRSDMNQSTMIRKRLATAAALGCVILAGGTTVYAVNHYLQPSQIAREAGEKDALAKAFDSKTAIRVNKHETTGNYIVTLLGIVNGQDLKQCISNEKGSSLRGDRSYAALAISRTDQKPMKDEAKTISPLICGLNWQDVTLADLDATLHHFTKDGILYELLECDDLEIFAGRGVQLGVTDQFGEEGKAFVMDRSGTYHKAKGYAGTNALFSLPLDASKGDEAAVTAYLEKIKAKKNSTLEKDAVTSEDTSRSSSVDKLQNTLAGMSVTDAATYIQRHFHKVTSFRCTCDNNGDVSWDETKTVSSGMVNISGYPKDVPSYCQLDTDGTMEGTNLMLVTPHKNNRVTFDIYTIN